MSSWSWSYYTHRVEQIVLSHNLSDENSFRKLIIVCKSSINYEVMLGKIIYSLNIRCVLSKCLIWCSLASRRVEVWGTYLIVSGFTFPDILKLTYTLVWGRHLISSQNDFIFDENCNLKIVNILWLQQEAKESKCLCPSNLCKRFFMKFSSGHPAVFKQQVVLKQSSRESHTVEA